jgi:predicted phosphodiesterase
MKPAFPQLSESSASGWLLAARLSFAAVALTAAPGCLEATPFGSEPERRDLTAKNIEVLAARPEPQGAFKIAALSDTHDDYDRFAKAVELINARGDIELVLHAGNMSDRGLLKELEWTAEILSRLQMPFFTAIGNHDAISEGKAIFLKMFGPYDYAFEWSGTKFVVFNSNTLEFPEEAPDRGWLSSTLADHGSAERLVVLTHHAPHYPDDLEGGTTREYYKDLLRTAGIDVFIHGHGEDFGVSSPVGRAPVLSLGAFQETPYYAVLTFYPEQKTIGYERCDLERCEELLPPPVEK